MKLQDQTGAARRAAMIRFSPLAASLLLTLAGPAVATESTQTPQLVGNKPVASNVTLSSAAPRAGARVTATWNYKDEDGDKESSSTVKWLIGGTEVAVQGGSEQGGSQYTLPGNSGGKSLQVKVIPESAAPAFPAVGDVVSSKVVNIIPNIPGNYTQPSTQRMDWEEADQYCKNLFGSYRLPTRAELIALFKTATGSEPKYGVPHYGMCDYHGWPLENKCGGSSNEYWTSNSYGPNKDTVKMTDTYPRNTPVNEKHLVTCKAR